MAQTILLADDSPTIRRVVELSLCDTEFRVEAVASGAAALERFERSRPDLVVADVGMPEPGGYELCRRIKQSSRPVPVLLLTGAFEPLDDERARACGVDGHLTKPFESAALLERIRGLLAARRVRSPAAAAEPAAPLSREEIERLAIEVVREIAREVVPRVAERLVRERIRELEADDER
jgi:CheY-like chemotaxis protein